MTWALALLVGALYSAGLFLALRRSATKIVIGLALVSHGANLLIFTAAGLVRGVVPIAPLGGDAPPPGAPDPLPPALILTAIVISFAVTVFSIVLVKRLAQRTGTDDPSLIGGHDA